MSDLNQRQDRFAVEYVVDGNGKRAAIAAGYSATSAEVTASKLLRHPKVGARIAELNQEAARRVSVDRDEILRELSIIARAKITDFVDWQQSVIPQEGGESKTLTEICLRAMDEIPPEKMAALARVENTRDGIRVVLHDKLSALRDLARLLGLDGASADDAQKVETGWMEPRKEVVN